MSIKSILLIEDNETDKFIAECIIDAYNSDIEIRVAYDGQSALNILKTLNHTPDLILLDIGMPGMDGFEFLDAYIETHENTAAVIMLTSSQQDKDKTKALRYSSVVDYVMKPIKARDLEKIDSLISNEN